MSQVMSSRPAPLRTYAAAAIFALVYIGVMVLVISPPKMFVAESGSAMQEGE
ncbi:MAG: hypothetical protein HC844_00785 [Tabrizicola sp.]|nr:hypothetical protein [Tabrizicola sp.]